MITKNKSKAYAIALLMTFLILATSITVLPATQAHTPSGTFQPTHTSALHRIQLAWVNMLR